MLEPRLPLKFLLPAFVVASVLSGPFAAADERLEGDFLYRVTTLRAAPGELAGLLDWHARVAASGYHAAASAPAPVVMRHSQGDHWDLMVLTPMGNWSDYHSAVATARRDSAAARHAALLGERSGLVAFEEDVYAWGPPWEALRDAHARSGLFHIEMFEALPGKADELLEQRRMENAYLDATGQTTNMIFRRAAGSDVDVFTIGFHESLETFAAPSAASDEEKEAAAKAAGFKDRADLSFYLRSLISGHHDTLAGRAD